MTRLVDLAQEMGLAGEASRSGRWIRVHGERGAVYVVEAAWGGYYSFCDARAEQAPELYLDPAAAIVAGLASTVDDGPAAKEGC